MRVMEVAYFLKSDRWCLYCKERFYNGELKGCNKKTCERASEIEHMLMRWESADQCSIPMGVCHFPGDEFLGNPFCVADCVHVEILPWILSI